MFDWKQFGRSMWKIPTGRKDGRVSKASEALASLPSPFANFTTLLRQFQDNDLDIVDLVTLSGNSKLVPCFLLLVPFM